MDAISDEEHLVIEKKFLPHASPQSMITIKKCIARVKVKKGIYKEVVNCKGDLSSLTLHISKSLNLDIKISELLSLTLWNLVKPVMDLEKSIRSGITHGRWSYLSYICEHPQHERLNGKKFPLKKGCRVGIFKRIHPSSMVGCGCMYRPEISGLVD